MPVLDEFRLGRVYERLDDRDRALRWYERFLRDWRDADPDIPEIIEARHRLAEIGNQVMSRPARPGTGG